MSHDRVQRQALDSIASRATRAIVDLDAIEANTRALKAALPAMTRLMAVVKADGYGHGAPWIARTALAAGAEALGVATVSEGETLRRHGIEAPVVLLGSIDPAEAHAACRARLEITVADDRLLDAIRAAARAHSSSPVGVHLKLDTGLRRYGAMPEMALALARQIASDPSLRFCGISTHFASSDEPDEPFTAEQLSRFERAVNEIAAAGMPVPTCHVANSAAVLTGQGIQHGMARPGIALYGVPPSDDVALLPSMRPALRLESRIARIVPLSPGDTVGYNRTFRAERPGFGALIPNGYADGYRRALAGCAWVGLHGERARLLGRVSMDQIVVEVPEGIVARPGDTVHILGGDPALAAPSVTEMASMMETNAYEVLVTLRGRIPRVYVRAGEVIGVRQGEIDTLAAP
jgi:alanine racemase